VKDPVSVELPRQLLEGEFQLDQLEIEGIPSPPSIERCQAEACAKRGEETGEQPLAPAAAAASGAGPVPAVLQMMPLNGPIGRGVNQPVLSFATENVVVGRRFVQRASSLSGAERRFAAGSRRRAGRRAGALCCRLRSGLPTGIDRRAHRLIDIRQRTVSSICVCRPRWGVQPSWFCALSMQPTRRGESPGRRAP
jgi:hypothetical protein